MVTLLPLTDENDKFVMQCSCGFYDQQLLPCRHMYRILAREPLPSDAGLRWHKLFHATFMEDRDMTLIMKGAMKNEPRGPIVRLSEGTDDIPLNWQPGKMDDGYDTEFFESSLRQIMFVPGTKWGNIVNAPSAATQRTNVPSEVTQQANLYTSRGLMHECSISQEEGDMDDYLNANDEDESIIGTGQTSSSTRYGWLLSYIGRINGMLDSHPSVAQKAFKLLEEVEVIIAQDVTGLLPKNRQHFASGEFASLPEYETLRQDTRKRPAGSPLKKHKSKSQHNRK